MLAGLDAKMRARRRSLEADLGVRNAWRIGPTPENLDLRLKVSVDRRGKVRCKVTLRRPHALDIALGIQPEATVRARRLEELVAPLPRAQELRADARATAQLTDPKESGLCHTADYTESRRFLDKT